MFSRVNGKGPHIGVGGLYGGFINRNNNFRRTVSPVVKRPEQTISVPVVVSPQTMKSTPRKRTIKQKKTSAKKPKVVKRKVVKNTKNKKKQVVKKTVKRQKDRF